MSDFRKRLTEMRRPAMLMRAARHGMTDYQRVSWLKRLVPGDFRAGNRDSAALRGGRGAGGNPQARRCLLLDRAPRRRADRPSGRGHLLRRLPQP